MSRCALLFCLCDPLYNLTRVGLDPNRYRSVTLGDVEGRDLGSLGSRLSEKERFKNADPFLVRCKSCQGEGIFTPICEREVWSFSLPLVEEWFLICTPKSSLLFASGPACLACHAPLGTPSLQVQLEIQIRQHISKYYEHWTSCDDQTCGNRTRSMGVYGRRCLRSGCRGHVTFEVGGPYSRDHTWTNSKPQYSDADLYNQLLYYSYLFDGKKAIEGAKPSKKGEHGVHSCRSPSFNMPQMK